MSRIVNYIYLARKRQLGAMLIGSIIKYKPSDLCDQLRGCSVMEVDEFSAYL